MFTPIPPFLTTVVEQIEQLYTNENQSMSATAKNKIIHSRQKTLHLDKGKVLIVSTINEAGGKYLPIVNAIESVVIESKLPVVIFSLSCSGVELTRQMIGATGKINQHSLIHGTLDDSDFEKLTSALKILNDAPIFIREESELNVSDICNQARKFYRFKPERGLIIIDNLQLVSEIETHQANSSNSEADIQIIAEKIELLAKELNIPIIILSELN